MGCFAGLADVGLSARESLDMDLVCVELAGHHVQVELLRL